MQWEILYGHNVAYQDRDDNTFIALSVEPEDGHYQWVTSLWERDGSDTEEISSVEGIEESLEDAKTQAELAIPQLAS